jgi:hypothetical protein
MSLNGHDAMSASGHCGFDIATNLPPTKIAKRGDHASRDTKPRLQPEENNKCCQDFLLPTSPIWDGPSEI